MNEDEQMPHPENAKQAEDEGEQGPGAKKWTLGEIHLFARDLPKARILWEDVRA